MPLIRSACAGLACVVGMLACIPLQAQPALVLDLHSAWTAARAQDPAYQAALAARRAGVEPEAQAFAAMLPNVSFTSSYNQVDLQQKSGGVTTPYSYATNNNAVVARQPLWRKSQNVQYAQSRLQSQAAEVQAVLAEVDLAQRLGAAYFDLLFSQDVIRFTDSLLIASQGQLQAARRGFEAGQGTRTDIDEAQARLDMAQAQMLQARQQWSYARQQIESMVGRAVQDLAPLALEALQAQPLEVNVEGWIALAVDHSPELRLAQLRVSVAEQEIAKAQAGHLPTVDAVGQYTLSNGENMYSPSSGYQSSQIGLQLSLPIYAGGAVSSAARQALALLEREQQLQLQTRTTLELQVRREYYNSTEGVLRVQALEQALQSALQLLASSRKGVLAGSRTQTDVLNALQREAEARRDLAQARYQLLIARQKLRTLCGVAPEQAIATTQSQLLVTPR